MNNNKWTTKEVRDILTGNPEALKSYNKGRSKKTWGNILLYGGLTMAITNVVYEYKTETVRKRGNFIPAALGGVMALVSIPIKIGNNKKIKKAIELYNDDHNRQVNLQEPKIIFSASQNQVALFIEF